MLSGNKSREKIRIIRAKRKEIRLIHHLFFDLIPQMPTGITNKYFATVSFTFITSGRKTLAK